MTSIPLLTGCIDVFKNKSQIIEEKLSEKYGCKFNVIQTGNRLNTGSVTAFVQPSDNKNINFTAVLDNSTHELTDDYINRKWAVEADSEITEIMSKSGIDTTSLTTFNGADEQKALDASDLSDFINKSGTYEIYTYIIVDEDCIKNTKQAQLWLDAVKSISEKYNDIDLLFAVYYISSEDYSACSYALGEKARVNSRWFSNYKIKGEQNIQIENKVINTNAESVIDSLRGE